MATRNLSAKFTALRSNSRATRAARGAAAAAGAGASASALAHGAAASAADLEAALPLHVEFSDDAAKVPQWVTIHATTTKDLNTIRGKIRELQKLHAERLKVSFTDDTRQGQEQRIDATTNEINSLLRRGEANVKLISSVGNDGTLSSQERTTRLNVMRNLATDLQQASRQFRDCQTVYFRSMAAQEQVGKQFALSDDGGDATSGRSVSLADAMDRGFTPHEIQELQLMERQANDREKEILRIAKSVNDLAVLFKELNQLVIEQGTVLDRIDYNIEQSMVKIKKGVVDLESANETSKKALTMKCIALLAIICLLLLIVFIWKQSS